MSELHRPTIRPAQPDDLRPMFDLRMRVFPEQLKISGVPEHIIKAHTKNWSHENVRPDWQKWLDDPRFRLRVVEMGKAGIVGSFIGMRGSAAQELGYSDTTKYVANLELDKSIRRQGLGRQLMEEFIEEDDDPTYLHVLEGNAPARAFYDDLGFGRVSRKVIALAGGRHSTANILMKKESNDSKRRKQ